jgi:UDP-N-acetylmuramyl pentapeptide phosphotransferase/UDP-N-acetylglucosamine-1-phosphate transferase
MNFTFPLQIAGIGFLAFVVSFLSVAFLRRWAVRRQILDIPNERSSHARPIPRGGGLAIVLFSLAGLVSAWFIKPAWTLSALSAYLSGAALIAVVSWFDDLRPVPNRIRFTAHSVGALLAVLGFGYWGGIDIPVFGQLHLGWPGVLVTLLWITGLTNAYNFMDGIDGIAGGQAVVAGLGWAVLGWLSDQPVVAVLGLFLATTSIGFLGHNWPPARIFMGDVGSAFLGYTFAVLPIICAQNDPRFGLIGVLLVWPFVFDTSFTFFRRLRNRENVFAAHRSHLYQRLVIAGCSHRLVTLIYMGLAFIGLLLALSWYLRIKDGDIIVTFALPLLCFGLWEFVIHKERKWLLTN